MNAEEYLNLVLEQIRCSKAKPAIKKELRDHIEDQTASFMKDGLNGEEAKLAAIHDMGDPVETGISLDRIHRPKPALKWILLISIISIMGFFIQYHIQKNFFDASFSSDYIAQIFYLVLGLLVMTLICFLDYSRIGYYAKFITLVIFVFSLISPMQVTVNGLPYWSLFLFGTLNLRLIIFLLIPLYGGILYSYKNGGSLAFFKSILWMLPALILAYIFYLSSVFSYMILLILGILLSIAIFKNWFQISKKISLSVIWSIILLVPAIFCLIILKTGAAYQQERLRFFFEPFNNTTVAAYKELHESVLHSQWIGASSQDLISPNFMTGKYILSYLITTYGFVAALVVIGCILFILLRLLHISYTQKNQLGLLMGVGAILVILMQMSIYVLSNIGYPLYDSFCPFLTDSGSEILLTYTLLGLALSIYKYENVLPSTPSLKFHKVLYKQVK